jgi:hypothetical protein
MVMRNKEYIIFFSFFDDQIESHSMFTYETICKGYEDLVKVKQPYWWHIFEKKKTKVTFTSFALEMS